VHVSLAKIGIVSNAAGKLAPLLIGRWWIGQRPKPTRQGATTNDPAAAGRNDHKGPAGPFFIGGRWYCWRPAKRGQGRRWRALVAALVAELVQ
jgi:hypothetical protein